MTSFKIYLTLLNFTWNTAFINSLSRVSLGGFGCYSFHIYLLSDLEQTISRENLWTKHHGSTAPALSTVSASLAEPDKTLWSSAVCFSMGIMYRDHKRPKDLVNYSLPKAWDLSESGDLLPPSCRGMFLHLGWNSVSLIRAKYVRKTVVTDANSETLCSFIPVSSHIFTF